MAVNIVVDDRRAAPEGWELFKTAEDFIEWQKYNRYTEITCLSLDHDLGDKIMNGYDLVHYMVDKIQFPNIKKIQFHTSNSIGFKNMYMYLSNAQKHNVIEPHIKIIDNVIELDDGEFKELPYKYVF